MAPARYDKGMRSPLSSCQYWSRGSTVCHTYLAEMLPRLGMIGVTLFWRNARIVLMMGIDTAEWPRMIEFRRVSIKPLTQVVGMALL